MTVEEGKDYQRHYEDFVECEWCGQLTRGRIYPAQPTAVQCGGCKKVIVNVPTGKDSK